MRAADVTEQHSAADAEHGALVAMQHGLGRVLAENDLDARGAGDGVAVPGAAD